MDKDKTIRCECGKIIFDGLILKGVAVAQFSLGAVNIKCKNCKRWIEKIPQSIFFTHKGDNK